MSSFDSEDRPTEIAAQDQDEHLLNIQLQEVNQRYIDLIGFVAHELKGILTSAVINAYAIRDGMLGFVNYKQGKAISAICRNLDYLEPSSGGSIQH